ncbi:hypothetical protein AGMMS49938_16440 [Fibrobacterales bacterium]|nr:hypothetical protein AGMMS49938_16440 [Fibrobacterales bacterium]
MQNILLLFKRTINAVLPNQLLKLFWNLKYSSSNLGKEREYILRIFCSKLLLNNENNKFLMEKAKKEKIRFSAQCAQDIIAYLFFKGKNRGFYIEIGANDGYTGSTTFWAEQLGWNGICVEPERKIFKELKMNRLCNLYNFAISDENRNGVEFINFPKRTSRSGISETMSKKQIDEARSYSYMSTITVDTLTFNDMMKDFPDIRHVDFLSIDTEGHEMNVIQSIDFDKYSFGLISIETGESSDVSKFVEKQGYKILMIAGSDVIFIKEVVS